MATLSSGLNAMSFANVISYLFKSYFPQFTILISASFCSMLTADAYRGGVMRRVTLCVRYVNRLPYKPGYTAPPPMFQLGGIPMNFRRDVNNPRFIAMVSTERNLLEPDYDDYTASTSRSLVCFRIVAVIFMVLLILRHTFPIIVSGAQNYSLPLILLLLLRTSGIILPFYVIVRAVNATHRRRRQQQQESPDISDSSSDEETGGLPTLQQQPQAVHVH
ncbi:hypothetical protein TEA_028761 [Camellia sinensis var. sinensis]|uniref:Uncharacterized protein n=1 Tax=Camellia sinensis var. sinensis TaxID=542762 RepID=A0A4S4EV70_CAMSN|nr:hypothetical protein TEA_028761 [Camellia sinensis var. sinensis]